MINSCWINATNIMVFREISIAIKQLFFNKHFLFCIYLFPLFPWLIAKPSNSFDWINPVSIFFNRWSSEFIKVEKYVSKYSVRVWNMFVTCTKISLYFFSKFLFKLKRLVSMFIYGTFVPSCLCYLCKYMFTLSQSCKISNLF